jgi:hypothetical protein
MVQVLVYTQHGSKQIRVGRIQFLPDPDSQDVRIVLDPPGCVPDDVPRKIRSQLLAGAKYGNVDWWLWRKEK